MSGVTTPPTTIETCRCHGKIRLQIGTVIAQFVTVLLVYFQFGNLALARFEPL